MILLSESRRDNRKYWQLRKEEGREKKIIGNYVQNWLWGWFVTIWIQINFIPEIKSGWYVVELYTWEDCVSNCQEYYCMH